MGAATNDTQVALALSDLVVVPSQMSEDDFRAGVETWRQIEEAEEVARAARELGARRPRPPGRRDAPPAATGSAVPLTAPPPR